MTDKLSTNSTNLNSNITANYNEFLTEQGKYNLYDFWL